jgi:hypothetical protein
MSDMAKPRDAVPTEYPDDGNEDRDFDLAEGTRVTVRLPGGGSCRAVIGAGGAGTVEIELLDEISEDLVAGAVVTVYAAGPRGLYGWRVRILDAPKGSRASLIALGAVRVIQRRRHARATVDLPGNACRIVSGQRGRPQACRVVDLSTGGLRMVGPLKLFLGDTVEVTVNLGSGLVALRGRVALSYGAAAGNRVIHVALDQHGSRQCQALVDFCARHTVSAANDICLLH